MRNRSNVFDECNVETGRCESADRCFTTVAGTLNVNFYSLHAMVDCTLSCFFSCHLCCERCALTGASESVRAGAGPAECVSVHVSQCDQRIVEGKGGITFEEAKRFLKPEPIISSIQKGSIVELISGPFKGERAKVVRIDESREEVVLELIEAAVPIPVTVKADQIRIIQKEAD